MGTIEITHLEMSLITYLVIILLLEISGRMDLVDLKIRIVKSLSMENECSEISLIKVLVFNL